MWNIKNQWGNWRKRARLEVMWERKGIWDVGSIGNEAVGGTGVMKVLKGK